jgi:hypothetical protein
MSSCLSTAFGVLFDIVQVLIGVADQATDIYIVYQLFGEKQDTRGAKEIGALMITFIVIACICGTVAFMVRIAKHIDFNERNVVCWYFLFLCFSPLLPFVNFVMSTCYPDKFKSIEEVDWQSAAATLKRQDGEEKSAAARGKKPADNANNKQDDEEEQQKSPDGSPGRKRATQDIFATKVAPQHEQLAALDGAIARRAGSFSIFALVTAAESVPNALLMLVYTSINPDAADWSIILSLLLSLASVATKGFAIARSATISAVIFKALAVLFDTFCFAFIAATIFSENATPEQPLLFINGSWSETFNSTTNETVSSWSAPFMVTKMTNGFIVMKIVIWFTCVCAVAAVGFRIMYKEWDSSCETRKRFCGNFIIIGGLSLMFFVCVLPVAIAQQAICLSWFVVLQMFSSPSSYDLPMLTLFHEFMWSVEGTERPIEIDWVKTNERLRVEAEGLIATVKALLLGGERNSSVLRESFVQSVVEQAKSHDEIVLCSAIDAAKTAGGDFDACATMLRLASATEPDFVEGAAPSAAAASADGKKMRERRFYDPQLIAAKLHQQLAATRFARHLPHDGNLYQQPADRQRRFNEMLMTTMEPRASNGRRFDTSNERLRHMAQVATFFNCAQRFQQLAVTLSPLQSPLWRNNGKRLPDGVRMLKSDPNVRRTLMPRHRGVQNNEYMPVDEEDIKQYFDRVAALSSGLTEFVMSATSIDAEEDLSVCAYSGLPCDGTFCSKCCSACGECLTDDCCDCCANSSRSCCRCCRHGRLEEFSMAIFALMSWLSALFSLFWFILYPAVYGVANWTTMQWICAGIAWAALLLLLLLLPAFLRYCASCLLFQSSKAGGYTVRQSYSTVIDSFFSVGVKLVSRFVPSSVVPSDPFLLHVLPFLSARHIEGLYGADAKELAQLKALIAQHDADEPPVL